MKYILTLLMIYSSGDMGLTWPVNGRITSRYGHRTIFGQEGFHDGIDISAYQGTWVRTAAPGLVIYAGEYGEYGNLVAVRHKDGTVTYYGHLLDFCVFKRQRLKKRQKVGKVGMTGRATGPHLHFEVRKHRKAVDPLDFLPIRSDPYDQDNLPVGGP